MGNDAGESDPSRNDEIETSQPLRRRSTYRPARDAAVRRPTVPVGEDAAIVHDDDELATALEREVTLLTASLPIVRPESLFTVVEPPVAPLPPFVPATEAERDIARRADEGDTLAAIEQLERLIGDRRVADAQPDARPRAGHDDARADSPELDADVSDDADDVSATDPDLAPVSTARVRSRTQVLAVAPPTPMPVFSIEQSGMEPTPLEYRVARASRLFWLWFAVGASILVLALGGLLVAAGLNLVQVLIAAVLGIALSFIPLGMSSMAGARSGQPTLIVSRAAFGVVGNIVPAALVLVVRLFWGAALLWMLAVTIADTAVGTGWTSNRALVLWSVFVVGVVVSMVVAIIGYALVVVVLRIAAIATGALALAIIVFAWPTSGWGRLGSAPFGDWMVVVEGAVLIFSVLGLAWASSGGDLARSQRVGSNRTATALWSGVGASVPMLVLVVFGAVVAIGRPNEQSVITSDPVRMLVSGAPEGLSILVVVALATGLVSALVVSLYSGGFAVQSLGVHLPRWSSVLLIGIVVAGGAAGLLVAAGSIGPLLVAYPTTLAVPVAAWTGILMGDLLLRRRRLATDSLLRRGGVYPDWRWPNVIGLVAVSAIGLGLVTADAAGLRWEGYLYRLVGVDTQGAVASADLGVPVALVLGLGLALVAGRRAVRRQETVGR